MWRHCSQLNKELTSNLFNAHTVRVPTYAHLLAIDALPTKNRWFGIHYLTVLYSTGSSFLSLLYYQKPLERRQNAIIPPRLYTERKGNSVLSTLARKHMARQRPVDSQTLVCVCDHSIFHHVIVALE